MQKTIKIAERLRPFSHAPGASCLIPGTPWEVQLFPTLLKFTNLMTGEKKEEKIEGGHTLLQDLEKNCVVIGKRKLEGEQPKTSERLSLGMHKSQDWDMVKRRKDLREIFPVWLKVGQEYSASGGQSPTISLLTKCEGLIAAGEKTTVLDVFLDLFQVGFQGILCPRLVDELHLGVTPDVATSKGANPLVLLSRGATLIRSLFLQEKGDDIWLLPCLPPRFDAGRFIGEISIEWSKKLLCRVIWKPTATRQVRLHLQKPIDSFRVRRHFNEKGKLLSRDDPLDLTAGETLYLDHFQK